MSGFERTRQWSAGVWFKSSRSYSCGDCVEVRAAGDAIGMRDSKDPEGPQLRFTREAWAMFVAGIRTGDFHHS